MTRYSVKIVQGWRCVEAARVLYMSPEQARAEETDERSDIFSFGAMLYEMATGQPAFPGRTTAVVFDEILNRTPVAATKVNAAVPVGLEAVIGSALEKDRERRYQTAAELHKDLAALHRGAPAVTLRAASGSRPAARRLGALAAGAVVVLGLLAWWFGAGRPAGAPSTRWRCCRSSTPAATLTPTI